MKTRQLLTTTTIAISLVSAGVVSVVVKSWHRILGGKLLYTLPELSQPLLGALVLADVLLKCLQGLIQE